MNDAPTTANLTLPAAQSRVPAFMTGTLPPSITDRMARS